MQEQLQTAAAAVSNMPLALQRAAAGSHSSTCGLLGSLCPQPPPCCAVRHRPGTAFLPSPPALAARPLLHSSSSTGYPAELSCSC